MKKRKIVFFIFVFIMITTIMFSNDTDYSNLFGEEISNTDSNEQSNINNNVFSLTPDFTLSFSGDHSFVFRAPVMPDHLDFEGDIKPPRFSNDIGLEIKYKFLKVVSHWKLDLIVNQSGDIAQFLKAYPLENSIVISPWKFRIGLGYQYFTWGMADGLNPTDNINARDYTLGTNFEKLSILSGFVSFAPVNIFSVEVIYVPFAAETKYPIDFVGYISDNLKLVKTIDPDLGNVFVKPIKFDPSSFKLGGKTNFFFQYGDFSFSYLYDLDPFYTPIIKLEKRNIPTPLMPTMEMWLPASIELVRNRLHRFGADFKTTVDRFGLWAELCFTMTENYDGSSYEKRKHQLEWVTGFDFNFGYDNQFYFNLQYTGRFAFGYTTNEIKLESGKDKSFYEEYYYREMTDRLANIQEALLQGIILKMDFPITVSSVTLKPGLTVAYYLPLVYDYDQVERYGSIYINPEFSVFPIESLKLSIGADLFFSWKKEKGKDVEIDYLDSLGVYNPSSSIYLSVSYNWGFVFSK